MMLYAMYYSSFLVHVVFLFVFFFTYFFFFFFFFFFSSRRRHTRSVSAFLLNRSSDLGIKSAIQGSNVPNPDEAVPSFVSGAMAKAGKGLLEGTLQAGTSAVSDKLLDLVGLGGKSAADKGKDTRDYLAAAFPELN